VQRSNGVVDIVVADETEAVRVAKRYLSYFQGRVAAWSAPDQAALRDVVPVDRLRAYDIRRAIDGLFDVDSVLELRREFGIGMVTALARIEGRPVGVIANDPGHLAGAIDSDGADKAARFMQLCDAFGLPIVTLVDTPGMMVGPDVEATALVRHCSRLFVTGANLTVPMVSVVTRKAYGLGAQAMMGGTTKAPIACLSWPTGEFGGMGLEGAVRLGYRKELEAVADDAEREVLFREMVDRMYAHGKAVSVASFFEIDDVIDPIDTRRWITTIFDAAPDTHRSAVDPTAPPRRPNIDTW
jgi:acetyl-CoA carboxylase carboxyltransferase component